MEQSNSVNVPVSDTATSGSFNVDLEKSEEHPAQTNPSNSNATTPSPSATGFPDGGLKAWLQVLGAFCIYFSTW